MPILLSGFKQLNAATCCSILRHWQSQCRV